MALVQQKIWSPNWSTRPNGLNSVVGVILHHTATPDGSGVGVANYFAKPSSKVSAHYVVDNNGSAIQCVYLSRAAWHAGPARYDWDHDGRIESGDGETSINSTSIGIEIVNKGDNKDTFPNSQVRKVASLISYANARCPNLRYKDITDHETVLPGYKIDMQPNFPAAKLFWWVINGANKSLPSSPYNALPRWAKKQVDEIKR